MERILFILNPVAGGGKAKALRSLIEEIMDKYNREYDLLLTSKPGEATCIAEKSVNDYEIIVAVGGDGTVNEVAIGLINKNKGSLGIIPGGTGNDLAKSLDISLDPKEALETLCRGLKRDIDIGNVNGSNFLNISSVGFDAEVVINNVEIKKKIKSRISYAISVVYTLFNFKMKRIQINIDDKILDEEIMLLAVGNGKYYGGGMKILPMAKVDDGYFDICVVSGVSKIKTLFLFPSIFKGNHVRYHKYVRIFKAKTVKIKVEEGIYLNIDGDVKFRDKEIIFTIEDKRLSVICEKK
ncbi:diacylglycerol kinase family lipid kinase [Tissierella sp.]|uniref:diacylglycerol/lipid kinase family protein n=1 Tax=Tissierella sp. TaxID=41274 RepID=UPI00285F83D6|nr:diacylglycerol kinase family lipid kinase [Tissierella sp.]MDR7854983.1 diacylglycerol kinase family lipid kinase [Tissierella sp.]